MRRIISSKNVTSKYIENLFKKADTFKQTNYVNKWSNKVMVNASFDMDANACLSFESAMSRLGGRVINYHSDNSHTNRYGSFQDTIQRLSTYGDIMALHQDESELFQYADENISIPIINAGSPNGDNVIQGLTDLYTIWSNFKMDENFVKILFVGDVKQCNSINSLLHLLSNFIRIKINFLPYKDKEPHYSILYHVGITNEQILDDIIVDIDDVYFGDYDVIYCAPMQSEENNHVRTPEFIVNQELLKNMTNDAIIMHPFPRNRELSTDLDEDERSKYFQQLQNGLYIRMALIDNILEDVP